jgi:hypothetical protein
LVLVTSAETFDGANESTDKHPDHGPEKNITEVNLADRGEGLSRSPPGDTAKQPGTSKQDKSFA